MSGKVQVYLYNTLKGVCDVYGPEIPNLTFTQNWLVPGVMVHGTQGCMSHEGI